MSTDQPTSDSTIQHKKKRDTLRTNIRKEIWPTMICCCILSGALFYAISRPQFRAIGERLTAGTAEVAELKVEVQAVVEQLKIMNARPVLPNQQQQVNVHNAATESELREASIAIQADLIRQTQESSVATLKSVRSSE